LLLTAVVTGLRASELRGLRWEDVDLIRHEVHVRRRADRYDQIGAPKSEAGERTVPLDALVTNVLRELKLASKAKDGLVFPNAAGKVARLANIVAVGLKPAMIAAGVTVPERDGEGNPIVGADGRPVLRAKYSGLHFTAALLRFVHQSQGRRRARIAAEGRAGAARPFQHCHDARRLRAFVSARRG
jgi:hypothetical protein